MQIQITLDTRVDEVTPFLAAIIGEQSLATGTVVVTPAVSAAEEAIVTEEVKEAVKEEAAKPAKRKRRTRKQIAADKAAEEAAIVAKAAAKATPDVDVTAEKVVEAPKADAPVVPATVDVEAVKQAVVNAISRLNSVEPDPLEENPKTATAIVVGVLEECTGKKRVGEIDSGMYGACLAALNNVAV